MINGSLPDRLEYAILEIVAGSPNGYRQYSWGGWKSEAGRLVPDYTPPALLAAFKLLWKGGALRLTKPDTTQRHYSGDQADDEVFFFNGNLNAALTANGRTYWGLLRIEKKKSSDRFASSVSN